MHKVKTLNNISDKGLGKFAPDGYELSDDHADPEAIVLRSHKLTANDITPSLRAVGRAGAGVNNVPVDVCTERGVVVFNTPGANAQFNERLNERLNAFESISVLVCFFMLAKTNQLEIL